MPDEWREECEPDSVAKANARGAIGNIGDHAVNRAVKLRPISVDMNRGVTSRLYPKHFCPDNQDAVVVHGQFKARSPIMDSFFRAAVLQDLFIAILENQGERSNHVRHSLEYRPRRVEDGFPNHRMCRNTLRSSENSSHSLRRLRRCEATGLWDGESTVVGWRRVATLIERRRNIGRLKHPLTPKLTKGHRWSRSSQRGAMKCEWRLSGRLLGEARAARSAHAARVWRVGMPVLQP